MLATTPRVLVNTTNLAADTYYYTLDMRQCEQIDLEVVSSGGVTITVEATLHSATPTWVDITESVLSLNTGVDSAANFVDKTDILRLKDINVRSLRVKAVAADNTNALRIESHQRGGNIVFSE